MRNKSKNFSRAIEQQGSGVWERSWWKVLSEQKMLHFMILPTFLSMIVFQYLPMFGIVTAFKNFNILKGIFGSPWAANFGMENFIDFFTRTPQIESLFINTFGISLLKLLFLALPPVILAIVLNELRSVGFKKFAQTVSYLPYFVSWVVIAGLIYVFFLPTDNAPVNSFLMRIGMIREPFTYLEHQFSFWSILVFSDIWKNVGFSSIIYIAVITGIDPQLYEAIEIDGGGRWAKIFHVTWPSLTGTFVILFILSCGQIMSGVGSSFDQVYILGSALNLDFSDIFSTYTLRVGLNGGRLSFASAVGLFQSAINLILLLSANRISAWVSGKSLF